MGIIDVYRHMEGAPLRGAYPVVVQFKARREKEQIMWRAKEKLRNSEIVVTEDSQQRLLDLMKAEVEKIKKEGSNAKPWQQSQQSPTKTRNRSQSPEKPMPGSPVKKSSSMNFSYSAEPPAHLKNSPSKSRSKVMSPSKSPTKMSPTKPKFGRKARHEAFNYKASANVFDDVSDDELDNAFNDLLDEADEEEYHDDLLDDFPEVPKVSKKKPEISLPPESPMKTLFEDFMF